MCPVLREFLDMSLANNWLWLWFRGHNESYG